MADVVSSETRSRMMANIKAKDTKPELVIRKILHAHGYRYRLHGQKLPGKPDIVLPKYRAVIFVNGCFWHGHDCHLFKWPKSRVDFWKEKISGNKNRDLKNHLELNIQGWRQLTVWECAIKGKHRLSMNHIILSIETWLKSKDDVGEICHRNQII